ncbi:MAG: DUF928 domain-containing protein [Pleurocapsa sp.]
MLVVLIIASIPKTAQTTTIVAKSERESSPTQTNTEEEVLDFSGTGRPGQQTAGDSRGTCPPVDINLTAIVPTSNFGKTLAQHPSFWFYIPYQPEQIAQAQFVLQDQQRNTVFQTPVNLPSTPGYIKFSLPTTAPSLALGKSYRWYLKLYCDRSIVSQRNTPLFVQGWIERVPSSSSLYLKLNQSTQKSYLVYGDHGIWYDAVNELLSLHLLDADNLTLQRDWLKLTQAKGVNLKLPDK